MPKILVLGPQGSGKSTSLGNIDDEPSGIKIKGLNPKETFIISCSNKALPFGGWVKSYPIGELTKGEDNRINGITGNLYRTNDGIAVANIIKLLNKRTEIVNIVVDDTNYLMQDYYMTNSVKGGYDVFKKIGDFMGHVFNAMELVDASNKNFIMIAHYEEYKAKNSDVISFRFKTVGNMVQSYITPEGKFEIVLFATQSFDEENKKVVKQFVTNYDGEFPAKSPIGMFNSKYIPNDMGYVLDKVKEYNQGTVGQIK